MVAKCEEYDLIKIFIAIYSYMKLRNDKNYYTQIKTINRRLIWKNINKIICFKCMICTFDSVQF